MAGTKAGGQKAAATNKALHGSDFYAKIGAIGGKKDRIGPYKTEEGCLSLVGSRPTQRYQEITVDYLDKHWQQQTMTLKGLPAQICQHELDHLEGIII